MLASLTSLPDLTALRVSNGALKSDKLPTRLKVMEWGDNPSTKGTFKIGQNTADILPLNQRALGFERVAIDYNHVTVPGSPEYQKGAVPAVFGYGRPAVVKGEGLFLEDVEWTPLGLLNARNFEDLSPAPHTDDSNEVDFIHSVALCPNGSLYDVHFFSAAPEKKSDGHDSPPAGYPKEKEHYADPANYKYPIDTEEHVRAAWSYIHQAKNREGYSAEELKYMEGRIRAAGKKFGITFETEVKTMSTDNKFITLAAIAPALGLPDTASEADVAAKLKTLSALGTVLKVEDGKVVLLPLADYDGRLKKIEDAATKGIATLSATVDGKVVSFTAEDVVKLTAKVVDLEKLFKDQGAAAADIEKGKILQLFAAEGKAPINPATKQPYSADELRKMDLPVLQILHANTPVTVPLSARGRGAGETKQRDPNLKGAARMVAAFKEEALGTRN